MGLIIIIANADNAIAAAAAVATVEAGGAVRLHLRLRTALVGRDQQQCPVHDGGAVKHGGHENVMAGAVHKRHVADQLHAAMAHVAGGVVLLERTKGLEGRRALAGLEATGGVAVWGMSTESGEQGGRRRE